MQPEDIINHYEEMVVGATPESVLEDEALTMSRIERVASVEKILPKIRQGFAFVGDCVSGRRPEHSKGVLKLIVGGLAYLALPNDIVPDFIPAVGFLDDVVVLEWIFRQVAADLNRHFGRSSGQGRESGGRLE